MNPRLKRSVCLFLALLLGTLVVLFWQPAVHYLRGAQRGDDLDRQTGAAVFALHERLAAEDAFRDAMDQITARIADEALVGAANALQESIVTEPLADPSDEGKVTDQLATGFDSSGDYR